MFRVHSVKCVSKMKLILIFIFHAIYWAERMQLTDFICECCKACDNTWALLYHHHQIGSIDHLSLFRVKSWNNGMHCMFFYVLMNVSLFIGTPGVPAILPRKCASLWNSLRLLVFNFRPYYHRLSLSNTFTYHYWPSWISTKITNDRRLSWILLIISLLWLKITKYFNTILPAKQACNNDQLPLHIYWIISDKNNVNFPGHFEMTSAAEIPICSHTCKSFHIHVKNMHGKGHFLKFLFHKTKQKTMAVTLLHTERLNIQHKHNTITKLHMHSIVYTKLPWIIGTRSDWSCCQCCG